MLRCLAPKLVLIPKQSLLALLLSRVSKRLLCSNDIRSNRVTFSILCRTWHGLDFLPTLRVDSLSFVQPLGRALRRISQRV